MPKSMVLFSSVLYSSENRDEKIADYKQTSKKFVMLCTKQGYTRQISNFQTFGPSLCCAQKIEGI